MAKVPVQLLLLALLYGCPLVVCKPKPPGKPRPKPPPPATRPPPPSKGFKEYLNRTIEENANKSKLNVVYMQTVMQYDDNFLIFSKDVGFHLVGGDILLTPGQQAVMEATANQDDPYSPLNAVINNEQLLWPSGRVAYILDSSLSKYIYGL